MKETSSESGARLANGLLTGRIDQYSNWWEIGTLDRRDWTEALGEKDLEIASKTKIEQLMFGKRGYREEALRQNVWYKLFKIKSRKFVLGEKYWEWRLGKSGPQAALADLDWPKKFMEREREWIVSRFCKGKSQRNALREKNFETEIELYEEVIV